MISHIYCYHENLHSTEHNATVNLWQSHWSCHGWTPHVLGPDDAKRHPSYDAMVAKAAALPTVNNRDFERACFVRWLAFASVPTSDPFVAADSDVFPRVPFPPRDFPPFCNCAPDRAPGFIAGTPADFQKIVDTILAYAVDDKDLFNGHPHVSDMSIFYKRLELFDNRERLVWCYGVPRWQEFPLTHFGNAYLKKAVSKPREIAAALFADSAARALTH